MASVESAKQLTVEAAAEVSLQLMNLDTGDNGTPRFENEALADELWSALELLRRATRSLDRALDLE